jgi:hypothetical protein
MRNNVFGAVALAAAVLVSGSAFAGDRGPDYLERQKLQNQQGVSYEHTGSISNRSANFTVIRLGDLNGEAAARIKSAATPASVEALQSSLDAQTRAELAAQGVQINNIVGSAQAFNGRTVFYVR